MSKEIVDFSFSISLLNARCLHYEQFLIPLKNCNCNKDVEFQLKLQEKINELRVAMDKLKSDNGYSD